MFKTIKSKLFLISVTVVFSFFATTLVSTALLIRKAHIDFIINDLLNDLNLFYQHRIEHSLAEKNIEGIRKIVLEEVEEHCVVDVIDTTGTVVMRSDGNMPETPISLKEKEFRISRKAYGYSVRPGLNGEESIYVVMPLAYGNQQIGFIRITTPLHSLKKILYRFFRLIAALFVAAMLISLVLNYLLSRSIYMPLLQMKQIAQEISSGKLDKTIEPSNGKDEIGTLVRVFNSMIEKLRIVKEERETIFSHIAHDLMTPITTIRGFMEILSDGKVNDSGEFKECLRIVEQESAYLETMIDKLRLLTRLDSLSMNYCFELLDIREAVVEAEQSLQLKIQAKNIAVHNRFDADVPHIRGDRYALKSVCINLLENAVKYSFENGTIIFSVTAQSGLVLVSIKDYGRGIASENHEKIFQRFIRINTDEHNIKGLGLGLGIVKEILTAHKARISVTSSLGEGAEFSISFLPAKPSVYKKFT